MTVLSVDDCQVVSVRTEEKDGYSAVQLGFADKSRPQKDRRSRASQASRAERGHVADIKSKRSKMLAAAGVEVPAKANCEPKKFVREIRGSTEGLEVGQDLKVDVLEEVKKVDVVGISKGRGFAGVMKRHNFSGQRASHGVKKCHRHAGGRRDTWDFDSPVDRVGHLRDHCRGLDPRDVSSRDPAGHDRRPVLHRRDNAPGADQAWDCARSGPDAPRGS